MTFPKLLLIIPLIFVLSILNAQTEAEDYINQSATYVSVRVGPFLVRELDIGVTHKFKDRRLELETYVNLVHPYPPFVEEFLYTIEALLVSDIILAHEETFGFGLKSSVLYLHNRALKPDNIIKLGFNVNYKFFPKISFGPTHHYGMGLTIIRSKESNQNKSFHASFFTTIGAKYVEYFEYPEDSFLAPSIKVGAILNFKAR